METPETGGNLLRPPETGGDQWRPLANDPDYINVGVGGSLFQSCREGGGGGRGDV